jgi:hypothetical protein
MLLVVHQQQHLLAAANAAAYLWERLAVLCRRWLLLLAVGLRVAGRKTGAMHVGTEGKPSCSCCEKGQHARHGLLYMYSNETPCMPTCRFMLLRVMHTLGMRLC